MQKISIILIILAAGILVGCGGPSTEYSLGSTVLSEDFSSDNAWEYYVDEAAGYSLQVSNGAYQIQTDDSGYIWGLNEQSHSDVVMEVTANQPTQFLRK